MIHRPLTRGLVILFVLCATVAMAATWTDNFENNIRQGLIEKAIKDALNENISQAEIVSALEQALLNGIVPEDKNDMVTEMVLAAIDPCAKTCGPSANKKCPTGDDLIQLCSDCASCPRCCE